MILLISLLFAFLFFLLLFLGLQVLLRRKREMAERIQMFSGYQPSVVRRASVFEILRSRLHEIFAEKAKRAGSSRRSRLDLMMVRAGLPLLGSEFLAISAGLSLFVFIIFALATFNPVTGLLAAFLFLAADFVFVQRRVSRRLNNFQRQLADCLSLVANSLRAGFSFLQTMEIISREMEPPMSTEFERVMRDTSLGKSLDEALHDMDERVGSADFSLVVTAVLIQQQVGGNLATILDTIRETISERIRLRREIGTLTAQGRATGIILACIPIALFMFFYLTSPEFIKPLLTTSIGHLAIGAAAVMEIIGFIIITNSNFAQP